MVKKLTIRDFKTMRQENRRFAMITVYDYITASLVNASSCEAILVGDSIGNIVYGLSSTTPVTIDMIIPAAAAVVRAAPDTFIIGDLPFGVYNESCEQAIASANRLMKETGCDCVKLEGGTEMADKIAAIVKSGTPVMGHIGLTPQTASSIGGLKVQGKTLEDANKLIEDIKAVEAAGAFACLIECVPVVVGDKMINSVKIPVFSGGAGPNGNGYGLNFYDMLGMFKSFAPKFVKRYAELYDPILSCLNSFHEEVMSKAYPSEEHSYNIKVEGLE